MKLSPALVIIPSNDNNIIDVCEACGEACGEAATLRGTLCAACDADVAMHCDSADFWPYDAVDMGAADYFPGKH